MKKKNISLIKLGGSIITNKEIPMSMKNGILGKLVRQMARAQKELKNTQLIVGHGSGSFGHVPASKYDTINGFNGNDSVIGMAIVQDAAAQLNRKVVYEFIKNDVPAVSYCPSNTLIASGNNYSDGFFKLMTAYLEKGLFPVAYGDVLVDKKQGSTIWSTERILGYLADSFLKNGRKVKNMVHVAEVAGFLDGEGKIISKITKDNWPEIKKHLGATKGFDVTGGMKLKIEESLKLAEKGIKSVILSGLKENNLYNYLVGKEWVGTEIS